MSGLASADDGGLTFTCEQAAAHAALWCVRNPAWMRICDLPDTEQYYVQWGELSARAQAGWGSEYGYQEFGIARCKVKTGFITGKGEFFEQVTAVPFGHNTMMVFRVGAKAVASLRRPVS